MFLSLKAFLTVLEKSMNTISLLFVAFNVSLTYPSNKSEFIFPSISVRGISSTASKENLYYVLNHFGIKHFFDIIITGEDVKFGKPNPEVYLKALEKLNIKNDQAIVFEDSDVGCLAAYDAGINYIKI